MQNKMFQKHFFFQKAKFHYKPACEVCEKSTFLSLRLAKGVVGI
jgi:hypothetical protein